MTPLRNERGAVFVLVGLALFLLAAVIGLATDYGVLAYARNQGQAAVDAAALAGASGIPKYVDDADDSVIQERIAALDGANDVRGFAADLGNGGATVDLLHWDETTNEFTCENDCEPELVNAVRVTKAGYETPVFFSWARNAFGGGESGTKTLNVSATAHLPCPDTFEPPTTGPGWGPIALRECKIGFPDACNVTSIIQTAEAEDNSAFTTFNLNGSNVCGDIATGTTLPAGLDAEVQVGDAINLVGTGAAASCLKKLDDRYQHCGPEDCTTDPVTDPPTSDCHAVLPVIDCAGSESVGTVKGFALVCFTNITSPPKPKLIETQVICPYEGGEGTGGTCLGTYSKQAVLVR